MLGNQHFWTAILFVLGLIGMVGAQGVPRDQIDGYLEEGEVGKAEKALKDFLARPDELSYQDSVYLFKNLGVLYAANPKKQVDAEKLFFQLLELDPFASLHDTYASHSILGRFKKIRGEFQRQKGGKALIPPVAVFDFQGAGFSSEERANITNQMIGEMQRLIIFHTLDRSFISETLHRMRKPVDSCVDRSCLLDIGRRLMVEYIVMGDLGRMDSVYNFQIILVSVETGQNSTVLRKVYKGDLTKVLAEGLPDLAQALQNQEAAWLNLSVQPTNTTLSLDGTPLAAIQSKLPVNPGKHKVCGTSPGYETLCRSFEVKKMDAVTYSIVLRQIGGVKDGGSKNVSQENWEDDSHNFSEDANTEGGKPVSKKTVGLILGGMGILVVGLILVLAL